MDIWQRCAFDFLETLLYRELLIHCVDFCPAINEQGRRCPLAGAIINIASGLNTVLFVKWCPQRRGVLWALYFFAWIAFDPVLGGRPSVFFLQSLAQCPLIPQW